MPKPWNKGLTKETDIRLVRSGKKISEKLKGKSTWNKGKTKAEFPQFSNSGRKKGSIPWVKGKTKKDYPQLQAWNKGLTKETDERVARNAKNTSASIKALYDAGFKPNTEAANKRYRELARDPHWIKRWGEMVKTLWQTSQYREATLRGMAKASHTRPNKPELILQSLLNEVCPNKFEYTGGGKLMIQWMIPDFANKNGKKQVIELFGDYWHSPEVTQYQSWNRTELGRIMAYNSLGYSCLVIWENELKNLEEVKTKIRSFIDAPLRSVRVRHKH